MKVVVAVEVPEVVETIGSGVVVTGAAELVGAMVVVVGASVVVELRAVGAGVLPLKLGDTVVVLKEVGALVEFTGATVTFPV